MDLDLQGSIEQFTLPEIFQLIATSRKSGTLGIQKDDSIVMVYFKEGVIIYGYGPRQTYHLGHLLREQGILSESQLEEAVNAQAKTQNSSRLGEILVTHGFIDRADLGAVIRKQIEELLYSLLSWTNGTFKFYENQYPTQEEITVNLSVENVILEGLRRADEMNMIKEALPDLDAVYAISAAQADCARDVNLQASEWNIMALVDGHRSINDICQSGPLSRSETLKKLAHLKLAGIIAEATKPPAASSTAKLEEMVSRLANLFEEYLTEKSPDRSADRRMSEVLVEHEV